MKLNAIKVAYRNLPSGLKRALRAFIIEPLRFYFRYIPFEVGKRLLWDGVVSHLWWLESNVTTTTQFGSKVRVDAADIVGRYIYYFGSWEPNLTTWIKERLQPDDLFVDVGANIGYFSLLASQCVGKGGAVIAIEALPKTAEILKTNLAANDALNVRVVNMAVWDKTETLNMFTRAESPPGTTTLMAEWADKWNLENQCSVAAAPLSEILTLDEVKRIRVIKIDVEGAEWHAIQGMRPILDCAPKNMEIILEVNFRMLEAEGKTFLDIIEFFGAWDFYPYSIENDYAANAYFSPKAFGRPARIERADQILSDSLDQIDVIFSRIDAANI
jgi:FkbM family methyltransferase